MILVGPYCGNLKFELLYFRPYFNWLQEIFPTEDFYVCSHFNRKFLYDIDDTRFFSIYEQLSRNEFDQKDNVHKKINIKDYQLLTKVFKDNVFKNISEKHKLTLYQITYGTNTNSSISFYQKKFKRLHFPYLAKNDKLLIIPDKIGNIKKQQFIFDFLPIDSYQVLGDIHCNFPERNELLACSEYFTSGIYDLFCEMQKAKAIICPAGLWTFVANLQGYPVFSWGRNIQQFKPNGLYNFNNKNCMVMYVDRDTPNLAIEKQIHFFLERLANNGGE